MNQIALSIGVAVVLAGIVGTLANAAALAVVIAPERLGLALVPGRYAVAIILCIALPFLARWLPRPWFWGAAIVWLTAASSMLAKFVFGVATPWGTVLGFNFVYALAALITYCLVAPRSGALRTRGRDYGRA